MLSMMHSLFKIDHCQTLCQKTLHKSPIIIIVQTREGRDKTVSRYTKASDEAAGHAR